MVVLRHAARKVGLKKGALAKSLVSQSEDGCVLQRMVGIQFHPLQPYSTSKQTDCSDYLFTMVVARAAVIKVPLNQASAAGRNIPRAAAPSTQAGNSEVARSHLMCCGTAVVLLWVREE